MRRVFVLTATALMLGACTLVTPYQPLRSQQAQLGGYSDKELNSDRWHVTFAGNTVTSRETVERYLMYRAAQLTLKQGYDRFVVTDRHVQQQVTDVGPAFGQSAWGGYWAPQWGVQPRGFYSGFGRPSTWAGGPASGGGPMQLEKVRRYEASSDIVMARGKTPYKAAQVFDARLVIANLQPGIVFARVL